MTDDVKIGVVVVTHGSAGEAMVATLLRMVGAAGVDGFTAVDIAVGANRQEIHDQVTAAVTAADAGAGVVVACDLHGSTPTNCAVELMRSAQVAVACGVNLPMLVKLATAPRTGTTPAALAQSAVDTAVRSIRVERGKE